MTAYDIADIRYFSSLLFTMERITTPLIYRAPNVDWEKRRTPSGTCFEVIRAFTDADGDTHRAGSRWTLLGTRYNKFENLIELGVRAPNGDDWLIPLGWDKNRQEHVIEHWGIYILNLD